MSTFLPSQPDIETVQVRWGQAPLGWDWQSQVPREPWSTVTSVIPPWGYSFAGRIRRLICLQASFFKGRLINLTARGWGGFLSYYQWCHLWDKTSGPTGLVFGDVHSSQQEVWLTQTLSKTGQLVGQPCMASDKPPGPQRRHSPGVTASLPLWLSSPRKPPRDPPSFLLGPSLLGPTTVPASRICSFSARWRISCGLVTNV